jgi:hypothetical protein
MTMNFSIIPDDEALSHCACCQDQITEETEVFSLGVVFKPDLDLSEYESHCIEIDLVSQEQPVHMMVTARQSDAKNEGKDGLFLLCSETCAKTFKVTLETEISLGNLIGATEN